MANASPGPTIDMVLTVTLSEAEVRAFDALVGYGDDVFLKVFYAHLGKAYMEPHEQGLRELFKSMRGHCADAIGRVDAARKAFKTERYAVSEIKKEPPHA